MNRMTTQTRWCTGIARWFMAAVLSALSMAAFGQANPASYDHSRSGFILSGVHAAQACESCHLNGVFKGTPRDCSSCHTAGSPHAQNNTVKPQRHVPAVLSCGECHSTQSFGGRTKFNHNTVTQFGCQTCHDGNGATGRNFDHVPVAGSQICSDCHKSFVNWLPSTFSHREVAVANRCDVCHNPRFIVAGFEDADHVLYRGLALGAFPNCDSCHTASFVNWLPAKTHRANNVRNDCRFCHDNNRFLPAVGQPATPSHQTGELNCEVCHRSTTDWADVVFVDTSVAGARVRNGRVATQQQRATIGRVGVGAAGIAAGAVGAARIKPANHIPLPATATCESCHRSATNMAVAIRMDHRAVAGAQCKSCHNGAFTSQGNVGARGKPANHIPEGTLLNGSAMDCSACHVTAANFASVRMNHNGSMGGTAGTCKTCHQQGANFAGAMDKRALNHRRTAITPTSTASAAAALDCSSSGCHRPQGRAGASYKSWN